MNSSFYSSLLRVTVFWYLVGALVLFLGFPAWAESRYANLAYLPWVPEIDVDGLATAAEVQWTLIAYWTLPVFGAWAFFVLLGGLIVEARFRFAIQERTLRLRPSGNYWGVYIPKYSLGDLPQSTTPALYGNKVVFDTPGAKVPRGASRVAVDGPVKEALKMLSPAERQLCEELLQILMTAPNHFAGLGHGVGLLEHTLNVVVEAASKCTPEFRLPLVAALAHDIGKLITFKQDEDGSWVRKGLHSRESARILATLPGFQELPEAHQRGLILAIKYDHSPNKMPELRGDRDASMLALRVITALASADKVATAAEKDRNLEKLQPEDLLWKDFVDYLRNAPVVQRGKKGAANQVNNPPDSPFLFLYEGQWREEAVRRLPPEVGAALDLNRRDIGKVAKYTRILSDRLRKEGLLVESHIVMKDGVQEVLRTAEGNPLWDIQSGTGEKAVVMRGIMVLKADELWKKVNYRLGVKSPFPVTILAPNAGADGRVNQAPQANREASGAPDVTDGLKLADVESSESMASLGLDAPAAAAPGAGKPKARSRGSFRAAAPDGQQDATFGLAPAGTPRAKSKGDEVAPAPTTAAAPEPASPDEVPNPEAGSLAVASSAEPVGVPESDASTAEDDTAGSSAAALAYLSSTQPDSDVVFEEEQEDGPAWEDPTEPDSSSEAEQLAAPEVVAPPPIPAPAPARPTAPAPKASAKPVRAPEVAPSPVASPASATELSRAEKREGIALADAEAVAKYPGLTLGDKFYTEESGAVQAGLRKPGSRYKGDTKDRKLELSEAGPRRRVRRPT